jgi:hypothetical protein
MYPLGPAGVAPKKEEKEKGGQLFCDRVPVGFIFYSILFSNKPHKTSDDSSDFQLQLWGE